MAKMSDLNVGWRHLIWAETSAHEVRLRTPKPRQNCINIILGSARTIPSRIGCHMGTRPRSLAKAPLLGLNESFNILSFCLEALLPGKGATAGSK